MNYSKWGTIEEMKNVMEKITIDSKVNRAGLPVAYDDESLYIIGREGHSLVIGSTGSGKTQTITLPMLELALRAGESVVIHDTKNELYDLTNEKYKNNGYNVIRLNFDDSIETSHWNPFDLPLKIYKEGNTDKAIDLIEDIAYYLFNDEENKNSDPFWINSAIDYFTGLTLYAFEHYNEVTLDTINEVDGLIRNEEEKILKDINSAIYLNLRVVIDSPKETKGSILSVYSQKIKKYMSKQNLKKMLSNTDFDIANIGKSRNILYLVSGNSNNSEYLLPLLISQIYYAKDEYSRNDGKINIILDDFFRFNKIKNFSKILTYSRSIKINFTIMVRGYNDISNVYDKEEANIIKINFANTLYFLSQDIETLIEISKLCGTAENKNPLMTVEELKTIKPLEAVVLTIRKMPFKTKLLPYFKMNVK